MVVELSHSLKSAAIAKDIVRYLNDNPCALLDMVELDIYHPLRKRARDEYLIDAQKRACDDADRKAAFVKKHTVIKLKSNKEELGRGAVIVKLVPE